MKCFGLTLLLLATAVISFAQNPTPVVADPGIEILKLGWNKERIGWQHDPFRGPIENFDEMRARARNERRIAEAKRGGGSPDKLKTDAKADSANMSTQHKVTPSQYVFTYKATIKNTSNKTIKLVDWDYVFYDRSTNTEIGRRQFTNEEKIGAGKSRELVASLTKPPTQTISVTSLNKNEAESLIGRVIIVRIEYADGSSWQAPEAEQPNP